MYSQLDLQQMARDENAYAGPQTPEEIEQMVIMARLELYNSCGPYGPRAIRIRLREHYALKPLPSERTIARLLASHGLSRARTGLYAGDHPTATIKERRGA